MKQNFEINTEVTDPDALIETFFKTFPSYEKDKEVITKAWNYLLQVSKGLTRSCGKPYYLHPMRIAAILADSKLDTNSIIAGFFHNILSLENLDKEDLEKTFGDDIFSLISGTSKITELKIKNKTLQQADSYRKMLFAMVDDIRVILIKLADRLDRMRNIKSLDAEAQKTTAQEVLDIWAPLANRLGMSSVKSELEDLCLKYTNPDVFQHLKKIVDMKKGERSEYLLKAEKEILKSAAKANIEISVSSRAKHFYSIYQKMRKRNKAAEELYDLLAIRIICKTNADCYVMIGQVHNLWKPLEGRFKDYIAMPKANGYQSLHTTVMFEGKPLEIQIRTEEMHSIAEHGVASHWLYKKGTSHDIVDVGNLSIINQLRELRKEHLSDEDFFKELREELLGDSIFVFTPNGEVREMPAGSTAIDFAYTIHSHIGETIVGAKANGHIIPLSTPLQNTQIIEILTNPQAHPTLNQLQIVKTAKARNKIRGWLLTNNPEVMADKDKEMRLLSEKALQEAIEKPKYPHKPGVGENPELSAAAQANKAASSENPTTGENAPIRIRIDDTTNFMINRARCCSPVYGDEIVGYVSRGRGIIVHKANCRNFSRIPNINERTIKVTWEEPDIMPGVKLKKKKRHQ